MKRAVMVWGTSSGAGKSLVATALCRWAARHGVDVAPFKAQNMSNNARVVPGLDGSFGEIGAAQYFQALAAKVVPGVDMNPVLLKPERDTASQVVLHGRVAPSLSGVPWRERSDVLAVAARESFVRLAACHDLVVIEGAGSPAETNLAAHDYVNLASARWAREVASVASLLVADIDRGGAFAHLYGTWSLLPDDLRPTLAGFVLNKFRGDATLLEPGPTQLFERTGVPVVGVLPMWREHGLPDEDGVLDARSSRDDGHGALHVAMVAYPRVSNLDEFEALRRVRGLRLTWARASDDVRDADWVVLPGSKQVSGDLAWLKATGLDRAVIRHAEAGRHVIGICGGLQMLGSTLADPSGIDGEAGTWRGLGLLPLSTAYVAQKRVAPARVSFEAPQMPWAMLDRVEAAGYEIRNGVTTSEVASCVLRDDRGQAVGWQHGPVLGVSVHGLFESSAVMKALFGVEAGTLDQVFDGLADFVERHIAAARLERWLLP